METINSVKTISNSQKQKIEPPKLYNVLLLNDDFTPMDFVVAVLEEIFFLSSSAAEAVMLTVHNQGKAICGIYAKDIAEMKVEKVIAIARANEHPLKCVMEEES